MRISEPLGRFSRFAYYALAILGGLFIAASVALTPFSGWSRVWAIPLGFMAGLLVGFFAPSLRHLQNSRIALFTVLGATLLAGVVWLSVTRVSPVMDFDRMYQTAAALAEGRAVPDTLYQAVFPHVLGYPFFLSLFFRVFGSSVAVAQAVNLLLSLCIAALLFTIGYRLLGVAGGLIAGLVWALLPSHFMMLSIVGSEPLHIVLTLLSVWLFLRITDCSGKHWGILLAQWAALGLTVGLSGLIRPLGPVYLLAFALCQLVFGRHGEKSWLRSLSAMLAMTVVYFAITQAGMILCEKVLDRPVAKNGFGWNLYVGMNRVNAGGWNAPDQEVMSARLREGLEAPEIQSLFQKEALSRLSERLRDGSLPRYMTKKFTQLWCQDSFTIYWLSEGAREDSPLDIRSFSGRLSAWSNIAYGFLLGLCALSLFRQIKARNGAFILPVTLLTGIVILFLLLEANPRYHYAGSAVLCLISAGCVIPIIGPHGARPLQKVENQL